MNEAWVRGRNGLQDTTDVEAKTVWIELDPVTKEMLNISEVENAPVVENIGDLPDGEPVGSVIFVTSENKYYRWDGTEWLPIEVGKVITSPNNTVKHVMYITQQDFDELEEKDPSTIYLVENDDEPEGLLPGPEMGYYVGELGYFYVVREGWKVANGQVIENADEECPKLWDFLLEHPELCCTLSDWNTEWNDPKWTGPTGPTLAGACGKYVIDEVAKTIKLIDVRGLHLAGAGFDGSSVSDVHADGIRNISGAVGYTYGMTLHTSEPFYTIDTITPTTFSGTGSAGFNKVVLDTGRIVPTDTTNHPRELSLNLCVYVGNPT